MYDYYSQEGMLDYYRETFFYCTFRGLSMNIKHLNKKKYNTLTISFLLCLVISFNIPCFFFFQTTSRNSVVYIRNFKFYYGRLGN